MTLIPRWADLAALIRAEDIRVVGLDMRGTLVQPPRRDNLARAFQGVAPAPMLADLDAVVPRAVIDQHRTDTSVTDWTLVTVLEAARRLGGAASPLDITAAFTFIQHEYLNESVPLVRDEDLAQFVERCDDIGVRVVIAADGPLHRESAVFTALFPRANLGIDEIFTSGLSHGNKLGTRYFTELARRNGVEPHHVLIVGDRYDKDVRIPESVGCLAVHVSESSSAAHFRVASFTDLVRFEHEPTTQVRYSTGAVLGRFQPPHLEHLRFILSASRHVSHLTVGVTQPFPQAADEGGGSRTEARSNPFPFWLRKQCIEDAVAENGGPSVDVVPLPLSADSLRAVLLPECVVFTTKVEEWSLAKEGIISAAGFPIHRLDLGPKGVTGTDIRRRIAEGDSAWRSMVPEIIATKYGEVLEKHLLSKPR